MAKEEQQYGLTKPISVAGLIATDLRRTRALENFLLEAGVYESVEEVAKREEMLFRLRKDWSLSDGCIGIDWRLTPLRIG